MCKANIELNLIIFHPIETMRAYLKKKKTNAMVSLAFSWHLKHEIKCKMVFHIKYKIYMRNITYKFIFI